MGWASRHEANEPTRQAYAPTLDAGPDGSASERRIFLTVVGEHPVARLMC